MRTGYVYYDWKTDRIALCLGSNIDIPQWKRFIYSEKPLWVETHKDYKHYVCLGKLSPTQRGGADE
jgi:hypothetical protein